MYVCMYTHIDARVGFFFVVFLVIYMIIYICYFKVCSVTTLTAPTFASFPLYATSFKHSSVNAKQLLAGALYRYSQVAWLLPSNPYANFRLTGHR